MYEKGRYAGNCICVFDEAIRKVYACLYECEVAALLREYFEGRR